MSASFIGQWVLEDLTICDDVINYFESSKNVTKGCSRTSEGEVTVDPYHKDCWETILDDDPNLYNRYTNQLQICCNLYIEQFPFCNIYSPWKIIEYINVQKYFPGQAFYNYHTERIGSKGIQSSRHLVFMTYLNDVESGGETEFPQQKMLVKPQKGLTLIWPADWTHTHRGLVSITETKYIITGWFNFY